MKKIQSLLLTIPALGLALTAFQSHAAIIAADTFTVIEGRETSSAITGSSTEVGDLTWNGGSQWVLRGDATNGYMGTAGSGNASIAVPFTFSAYEQYGDVATISFTVAWRKQSATWFGIGFSSNATGSNITGSGAVWLQINFDSATWSLKTNASGASNLPSGDLTDAGIVVSTATSTLYTYALSYDSKTRTVTDVSINGVSVLSDYIIPEAPGEIASVAFFGQKPYNTATGTMIDNFSLSVNPIPEPAGLVLLAGAATLTCAIIGRRR